MDTNTLQSLIRQNAHYVLANTAGLTQEESLRPSAGLANPFNWILGHVTYWRNALLAMAGETPVWGDDDGGQYRGNPEERRPLDFDPASAYDLARLTADFQTLQVRLDGWNASRVDPELPPHFLNLVLHEAYHAGQLGILRRALGKGGAV